MKLNTASEPDLPQPKVALIVGPDDSLAEEISAILPDWNMERVPTNSSALTLIQRRVFDLVVTGRNTSAKADIELLRKIRRVRPHIRLIIVTSESTPIDVIESMREYAFSFFSTPFSKSSFSEIIRIAAEGPCWDDGIEVVSATPDWIRILARCDKRIADRLLQFVREMIELPERERDDVAMAFREMLLNAMEHGALFDPTRFVEISYLRARHAVICRVKDPGEGFLLSDLKHAAVANPADDPLKHQVYRDASGLRPGGFGILIAKNLVDDIIYGEKGNDVLLIKYIGLTNASVANQI